jgi:predicted acyl esterase
VDGSGKSGEVAYTSAAFSQSTVVTGVADLTLRTSFSQSNGVIFAELQDVAPDGTATLMGVHTYLKASYRDSNTQPTLVTPGQTYDLKLQLPSKFWSIAAGHRLRLRVYSEDGGTPENATALTVSISSGAGSFIDFKQMPPTAF